MMFGTGEPLDTDGWDAECVALCQAINYCSTMLVAVGFAHLPCSI